MKSVKEQHEIEDKRHREVSMNISPAKFLTLRKKHAWVIGTLIALISASVSVFTVTTTVFSGVMHANEVVNKTLPTFAATLESLQKSYTQLSITDEKLMAADERQRIRDSLTCVVLNGVVSEVKEMQKFTMALSERVTRVEAKVGVQ